MTTVLVVEDGVEYSETFGRFLGAEFAFARAGSGAQALHRLREGTPVDVIFLDMRFDRAPESELLGDLDAVIDRFNGDVVQARRFTEDHQGTFILAALRDAGITTPVVLSYDFGEEPGRWRRISERQGPVDFLPDNVGRLRRAARGRS